MGSLGGEVAKKKAMWIYPRVIGLNPSERWGHSACYCDGLVYVFGVRINFENTKLVMLYLEFISWFKYT